MKNVLKTFRIKKDIFKESKIIFCMHLPIPIKFNLFFINKFIDTLHLGYIVIKR